MGERSRAAAAAAEDPADPASYAGRFPREYASYQRNSEMTRTTYGGSEPYSKLERYPWLKDLYAGYAFSVEYNEERGHTYSVVDVTEITRKKPGATCWTSGLLRQALRRRGAGDRARHRVQRLPRSVSDYYDAQGFADWTHPVSGAAMIKIQHPDYEFSQGGFHQKIGLSCADCHMPKLAGGGVTYRSHWWTSPLKHVKESCGKCPAAGIAQLPGRVEALQGEIQVKLAQAAQSVLGAGQAIGAAAKKGASEEALAPARAFLRQAQLRVDWLAAENSAGFHNAARARATLAEAENLAAQARAAVGKWPRRLGPSPHTPRVLF